MNSYTKSITVFLLLFAFLSCRVPISNSSRSSRLNLVMICLDTVRFDTFRLPENQGISDSFSKWSNRALRFLRAQSSAPWTIPSVASTFTGLYPNQHGTGLLEDTANLKTQIPSLMPERLDTLAEALASRGYKNVALVAHPWFAKETGILQGMQDINHLDDESIIDKTLALLPQIAQEKKPFFLYLHFMKAHAWHFLSESEREGLLSRLDAKWETVVQKKSPGGVCADPENATGRKYLAYLAAVLELRRQMSLLMESLERTGLLSHTVVVVFSDHGEEFTERTSSELVSMDTNTGEYEGIGHGHTLYQELLHVPILVWHPEFDGRDVLLPVSNVDLPVTIGSWLKIRFGSTTLPGIDQDPALRKKSYGQEQARPLFSSNIAYGEQGMALLWKNWKIIHIGGRRLTFDLRKDPAEKACCIEPPMEIRTDSLLSAYSDRSIRWKREIPELSREQLEELQALGYLNGQ